MTEVHFEGARERWKEFRRESHDGEREVIPFLLYLRKSLKDVIWSEIGVIRYGLGHNFTMKGLDEEFITGCGAYVWSY